uniref:Uncharacterized protein n=1 Tax=Attheya septentrionalis TaxID=420275 RepID=A0A7S2UKU3_9STRA|mmetsp:Transcript_27744/g.50408  ORF Transcript_27744/g.50408 Transcript_27744/m.50408 type:complete len:417 (+) Transcript_27744:210-1460(+)
MTVSRQQLTHRGVVSISSRTATDKEVLKRDGTLLAPGTEVQIVGGKTYIHQTAIIAKKGCTAKMVYVKLTSGILKGEEVRISQKSVKVLSPPNYKIPTTQSRHRDQSTPAIFVSDTASLSSEEEEEEEDWHSVCETDYNTNESKAIDISAFHSIEKQQVILYNMTSPRKILSDCSKEVPALIESPERGLFKDSDIEDDWQSVTTPPNSVEFDDNNDDDDDNPSSFMDAHDKIHTSSVTHRTMKSEVNTEARDSRVVPFSSRTESAVNKDKLFKPDTPVKIIGGKTYIHETAIISQKGCTAKMVYVKLTSGRWKGNEVRISQKSVKVISLPENIISVTQSSNEYQSPQIPSLISQEDDDWHSVTNESKISDITEFQSVGQYHVRLQNTTDFQRVVSESRDIPAFLMFSRKCIHTQAN